MCGRRRAVMRRALDMLLSLWVMVGWWTDLDPEVYPLVSIAVD